jgi:hypothetical protein
LRARKLSPETSNICHQCRAKECNIITSDFLRAAGAASFSLGARARHHCIRAKNRTAREKSYDLLRRLLLMYHCQVKMCDGVFVWLKNTAGILFSGSFMGKYFKSTSHIKEFTAKKNNSMSNN